MRQAFVDAVSRLMDAHEKVVLILCDISVHAFRNVFAAHPTRCFNIGINEQAAVSIAAGFAREGFYPVTHSIEPFLVERALEQIKVDFGYQNLPGLFVTVGASYDYAHLGATHHCPGSVQILKTIPNMRIMVPASGADAARYIQAAPKINSPMYVRLAEDESKPCGLELDEWSIRFISDATNCESMTERVLFSIGTTRDLVASVADNLQIKRMHIDQVQPFPEFRNMCKRALVIEPFYEGTLAHEFSSRGIQAEFIGVPRRFLTNYGTRQDMAEECGLTEKNIAKRWEAFCNSR